MNTDDRIEYYGFIATVIALPFGLWLGWLIS
jgi:hypothetical protein